MLQAHRTTMTYHSGALGRRGRVASPVAPEITIIIIVIVIIVVIIVVILFVRRCLFLSRKKQGVRNSRSKHCSIGCWFESPTMQHTSVGGVVTGVVVGCTIGRFVIVIILIILMFIGAMVNGKVGF